MNYNIDDTIQLNVCGNVLECTVAGVIEKGKLIPTFHGAAADENFTADFMFSNVENTIIIPETEKINQLLEAREGEMIASGSILYTDGTIAIDTVRQKLGFAGVITDIAKGGERFRVESEKVIRALGTHFILCLSITALCCWINNIIGEYKILNNYRVYYLMGMPKSALVCIELIKAAIIVLGLSVFFYILLLNMGYFEVFEENISSIEKMSGIIMYLIIMYCPAFVFNLYQTKNMTI